MELDHRKVGARSSPPDPTNGNPAKRGNAGGANQNGNPAKKSRGEHYHRTDERAITPFGGGRISLRQLSRQSATNAAERTSAVHKWRVFNDVRDSKEVLGATDRALTILNALLTFHPETALTGTADLIVWPSNELLSARAYGMPATTLRRHIAVLVECGLVIRRDSPNGKRFARRGRDGEIEQAYGFDLTPLVARAGEFRDLAEAVHAERRAFRVAKERLTLLRRDIVKMIHAGIDENAPGDWSAVEGRYQRLIGRLPRTAPRQLVESISNELAQLSREIRETLETFANSQNPGGNAIQSGCHIQSSKPDASRYEFEDACEESDSEPALDGVDIQGRPKRELCLGIVLDACPSIRELAQGGEIRHWRDFLAATELARSMLGISPSAWRAAQMALGQRHAGITLAAIYQRADLIVSPGGYVRSLTARAKAGKFSTWPMIMALLRAKLQSHIRQVTSERREGSDHTRRPAYGPLYSERLTGGRCAAAPSGLDKPQQSVGVGRDEQRQGRGGRPSGWQSTFME